MVGRAVVQGGGSGGEGGDEDDEAQRVHRLAPQYVHDINSPLRHVRTRIYFTSESHIHALLNLLRHTTHEGSRLVSGSAAEMLDATTECDYLTQIVLRLYENKEARPCLLDCTQTRMLGLCIGVIVWKQLLICTRNTKQIGMRSTPQLQTSMIQRGGAGGD